MGVYTIAGGKGGVGKSTTTATLGITLSEVGYEVALVDADLAMANLADVVGSTGVHGIHGVLAGEANVDEVLVEVADGLAIVPGGRSIDLFEAADPANLGDVVSPLDEAYDVVLVDTGAGLSHEALVATGLADGTVLVTTPQDESVADVAKTAEFVAHADATVLGAVVTRTDRTTDLGSIADRLGVPLLGAVPEDPSDGADPLTEDEAGLAYEQLAATLVTCQDDDHSVDAAASVDWIDGGRPATASSADETTRGVTTSDD